ncbi:hypothetical protein OIU79_000747 [Salix purpurea]|uniref:Uncharacterized protein n=1 Tax=Salix purpurea TaxID=77065 RepID=A0A9Q0V3V3_SALPP|nr:hypothetical protein OIU79_000747 [Salix purpurea]
MAMATAELKALCAFHPKTFTDSDVAAAQQLVQLSGEDSSSCSNKKRRKNKSESGFEDDQESDRSSQIEITSKMIEEIFGIEDEVARPRKQRYRSLVSIYQQAMDMPLRSNVRYGKEVSTEGNLNRALAREEEGDQCSKTQAIRRLF